MGVGQREGTFGFYCVAIDQKYGWGWPAHTTREDDTMPGYRAATMQLAVVACHAGNWRRVRGKKKQGKQGKEGKSVQGVRHGIDPARETPHRLKSNWTDAAHRGSARKHVEMLSVVDGLLSLAAAGLCTVTKVDEGVARLPQQASTSLHRYQYNYQHQLPLMVR
ncbi:hypothetical protein M426DRAFT_9217 [Hypoxylon sp. CI-4A]|nr:hypothetical protein M426DRAFT_9217 [Hypoxylon sp. CI-4A]